MVIVTHNSEPFLGRCLAALERQGPILQELIVVDAGSESTGFLESLAEKPGVRLVQTENRGFSRSNSLGFGLCQQQAEYVVFLNPDAFVQPDVFDRAVAIMEQEPRVGCLTGRLLGYDITLDQPTGLIDSTGIFRKWYGRWYDRGQGESFDGQYSEPEDVPAACGAFLFCRSKALASIVLADGSLFDPDFFMYKEDIELSLRLRSAGWRILYHPELEAFHCRGWSRDRKKMSLEARRMAAGNEVLLYRRHPSVYMLWAVCKFLLVSLLRL